MTSTIYKFEYRQGIVVVTFSAAMLWKQDYAQGAHVCRVPCQNRRDTMTLLVMVAAGRLAASHCGTDKDATALSLFGLPRSQEIISMPPPPRAAARASGVGVGSNVAFTDRAGQRLVGSVKSIRKNAQVLVPDPTKRGEIYTIKSSGRRVHYAKWNISLNLLSPATAQDMARHAEQERAAEAVMDAIEIVQAFSDEFYEAFGDEIDYSSNEFVDLYDECTETLVDEGGERFEEAPFEVMFAFVTSHNADFEVTIKPRAS